MGEGEGEALMLPTEVKVGAITYTVNEQADMNDCFGVLGQIIYPRTAITVDANMTEERKEQVFIHELTHAIFHEAGFDEQDEDVVNRVSMFLYQVLKDNQNLLNPLANVTSVTIGGEWDSAAIAKMTEELKNIPLTALQVKA